MNQLDDHISKAKRELLLRSNAVIKPVPGTTPAS